MASGDEELQSPYAGFQTQASELARTRGEDGVRR